MLYTVAFIACISQSWATPLCSKSINTCMHRLRRPTRLDQSLASVIRSPNYRVDEQDVVRFDVRVIC